jgi:hypothetical protein
MLGNYYQVLFIEKTRADEHNHFGLVAALNESAAALGYALGGIALGRPSTRIDVVVALLLTALCGGAWLVAPLGNALLAYGGVVLSSFVYAALKTHASTSLARALPGHYGLAFSVATLAALCFAVVVQTIMSIWEVSFKACVYVYVCLFQSFLI